MNRADFSTTLRLIIVLTCFVLTYHAAASEIYIPTREDIAGGDIEIVAGEEQTVYEYRVNGHLLMIKIVPKVGFPYYLVPADGSPHYISLDHSQKLYPNWVLVEW